MSSSDGHLEGPWRVRVSTGPTQVREYVWASERNARQFAASLDPSLNARVVDPRGRPAPSEGPAPAESPPAAPCGNADRYQIHVAISARRQLKDLPAADWNDILRCLIDMARAAGSTAPASREVLEAAGIDPPYLRLRAGKYIVICDADPARRAVTVLHVLPNPARRSPSASAA